MIVRHFFEGGPFHMFFIYLMWTAVFILTVRLIILYRSGKDALKIKKANNNILFIGSFAFLFGISGQMIGLYYAYEAISKIAKNDINPSLIADGLRVSSIPPLYGLLLLLFSAIIWYIFRNLNYTGQEQAS